MTECFGVMIAMDDDEGDHSHCATLQKAWFAYMIVALNVGIFCSLPPLFLSLSLTRTLSWHLFAYFSRIACNLFAWLMSKMIETHKHLYESVSSKHCLISAFCCEWNALMKKKKLRTITTISQKMKWHSTNFYRFWGFLYQHVLSYICFWMDNIRAQQLKQINKKLNYLLLICCTCALLNDLEILFKYAIRMQFFLFP